MATNIEILNALELGSVTIQGEFMWGSNYTFLTQIEWQGTQIKGVYKPSRGERPLWDFPAASLAKREAAAFLVSEALGWGLVPPTIYRKTLPLGPGSLQHFVEHDPEYHYFNFSNDDHQRLRPVVIFDFLINNADRKGSHILRDPDAKLWLIDHGVCFHVEDKLRTVIWDFAGEPIPDPICSDISCFISDLQNDDLQSNNLYNQLCLFISQAEINAMINRASSLIANGFFPAPDPYRRPFPWPQI